MLALLLGCGLRRSELVQLKSDQVQEREDHWVIVDPVRKARHVRTVPIPPWVKDDLDAWTSAAGIREEKLFRSIRKDGAV
jgi:integrase